MRLSWNEVRTRAAQFTRVWAEASYEKGETQSFYNDFFQIFGVKRRSVARYEIHVQKLDNRSGFIDLFWPGVLLVEQKSAGRDLTAAFEQASDYFDALPESQRPRYLLVSDFQHFELYDLDERTEVRFTLAELPVHVEDFGFILGVQQRQFRDQDPVNIEAAERVGHLRDALEQSGYPPRDLERFLVRLVFCLFADDTGVFEPRDIFLEFLEARTGTDGSDLGIWLAQLFEVLNTPEERRLATLDEDIARFPYVNGALFQESLRFPAFSAKMRKRLLAACHFDWSRISPAIFGSLFQSVMDPETRRAQGAHYTTEQNILKVIGPLFLDDLKAEFARLKNRRRGLRSALQDFQARLGTLNLLDPACGCGNFLIIAYRELRLLEIEVLRELYPQEEDGWQQALDVSTLSRVNVDQFYGIDLGAFPVRIAETALWMMDHILNNHLSLEFGQNYARIPLRTAPRIVQGDALEMDWAEVLPPAQCSFVLGNPPFRGAKFQTPEQRAQVHRIAALGKSGGSLDYVAAWFLKAGTYIKGKTRIGFVSTNSTTQGEQAAQLWPLLHNRCGLELAFAHRTFAWGSDAKGKANVHVVILGWDSRENVRTMKRLYSYPDVKGNPEETAHRAISPYLFDASRLRDHHLTVREESRPINGLPQLIIGSKPIDDGNYIFTEAEREEFLGKEPGAEKYLHPYIGAKEFLHGKQRWILALHSASPVELAALPRVRDRLAAVKAFRLQSKSKPTQVLASTPTLYHVNVIPQAPFLVVPEVSSERREYLPIAWLSPPVIPSNKIRILQDATLEQFALLTSAMHMAWMRAIGGRLESRYSYGIGIVYNTFPLPSNKASEDKISELAKFILEARAEYPDASLANLYDPDLMPPRLKNAHQTLDRAIDRLYRPSGFENERDRVEHLLERYEVMRSAN